MNAYDEFIMSYPTGKWKLDNILKPDLIVKNVKTSEQLSAENNKKSMNNEFICDNINSDNEGFTNYEDYTNCRNNNINTNFIGGIFIVFIIFFIFIYTIIQIILKK